VYTHKVLTMIKNVCTLHYLFFVFSNQTRFIMATYMNVAENNCKHKADLSFKLNVCIKFHQSPLLLLTDITFAIY